MPYPRGGRCKRGRSCWCQRACRARAASRAGYRSGCLSHRRATDRHRRDPGTPDADALLTEARTALASGFTGYCVSDPERLPDIRALFDECAAPFGRLFR